MKKCNYCYIEKSIEDFHKRKASIDGLSPSCKICNKKKSAEYYQDTKEETKRRAKKWAEENREKTHIAQKKCRTKFADKERDRHYKMKYGITIENYNQMLINQEEKCKTCRIHQDDCKKRLSVDHCHKTGKVRGLLCDSCNKALGSAKDSADILKALANYIDSYV